MPCTFSQLLTLACGSLATKQSESRAREEGEGEGVVGGWDADETRMRCDAISMLYYYYYSYLHGCLFPGCLDSTRRSGSSHAQHQAVHPPPCHTPSSILPLHRILLNIHTTRLYLQKKETPPDRRTAHESSLHLPMLYRAVLLIRGLVFNQKRVLMSTGDLLQYAIASTIAHHHLGLHDVIAG